MPSHRRLRILVLASTFPRWHDDTEPRFILELCQHLADAHDVTVLTPAAVGAADSEWFGDVRVFRHRYAPLRRWERLAAPGAIVPKIRQQPLLGALVPLLLVSQLWSLARLIRRERFDVIHCNWIIPQGFTFALLSCFTRMPPAVLTCLGADAYILNRWPISRLKAWILRRFDRVTVVSADIARELAHLAGAGGTPPIRHIPTGVDLARFRSAPRTATPDKHELLFVARLAEKKGLDVLLAALKDPRLCSRSDFCLTVVGDGPLRRQLELQAADPALTGKVRFVGSVNRDVLSRRLAMAQVFCAPYIIAKDGDRDGMPAIIMEAAASGLPVIASDIGGMRDVVQTRVTGWLVPAGDVARLAEAIADALDHPDRLATMGLRISELVKSYAWKAIAEQYAEEFSRAIAMRRGDDGAQAPASEMSSAQAGFAAEKPAADLHESQQHGGIDRIAAP